MYSKIEIIWEDISIYCAFNGLQLARQHMEEIIMRENLTTLEAEELRDRLDELEEPYKNERSEDRKQADAVTKRPKEGFTQAD